MEFAAILLIPLLLFVFLAVCIIKAAILGWRALWCSRGQRGPYAQTLRLLAINLWEPTVNIFLVSLLAIPALEARSAAAFLWATAPMAVLLLPALGLWFRDRFYRVIALRLLGLGLMRWALCVVNLWLISTSFAPIMLVSVPFAIGALFYSLHVGDNLLKHDLAAPPLAPAPVVAPIPPIPPIPLAPPAPPPDPGPPVRCPLCHAITGLHDEDCAACGLVFRSRIPAALQGLAGYSVLRPLGAGGMSSVYLARNRAGERLCVLKTLVSVDAQADPEWQAEAAHCLRQEAALLRQLDHPRIARLLAQGDTERDDFLVLAYVAGPTLEQTLTRPGAHGEIIPGAALPPGPALAYAAGVAEILVYLAHRPAPVLHLDIKPANLILPPGSDQPVLVDFGGAALAHRDTRATARLAIYGTPGYAAPEQYRGAAKPASDIYGLAATLYHLLTDDDPAAHPLRFPALAGLPPAIAAVLTPALDLDPAARPDAATLRAQLGDLAGAYAAGAEVPA